MSLRNLFDKLTRISAFQKLMVLKSGVRILNCKVSSLYFSGVDLVRDRMPVFLLEHGHDCLEQVTERQ